MYIQCNAHNIMYTQYTYNMYIQCIYNVHTMYTHIPCAFNVYTMCIQCTHIYRVHSMYILCTYNVHTYNMFLVHTMNIPTMYIQCSNVQGSAGIGFPAATGTGNFQELGILSSKNSIQHCHF